MVQIFKVSEDVFLAETKVNNFNRCNLNGMVEKICLDERVISNLEVILEETLVKPNDLLAQHVLLSMVKLYIRVWGFSHAKMLTQAFDQKQKGLRKELKRKRAENIA